MENLEKALDWLNENKHDLLVKEPYRHASFIAHEMLKDIEQIFNIETYGIEGWSAENGNKGVNYLNNGDPYVPTIFALASFNEIEFKIAKLEEIMNSDWFLPSV